MNKEQFENTIEADINCEDGQMGVILYIPKSTVKLTLTATVIDSDNDMHDMTRIVPLAELYDARVLGDEWEGEHVQYRLTEEGEKLREQLLKEKVYD